MSYKTSRIKRILWGNDPKDAALLMKLDITILPYFSIIWFLFGLSRASYSSAYISGMGDELHFKGKDFNYLNTTYLVVYAICQMPGTSLLTIASPRYVFVIANVTWSILTLITFKMQHVWQVILLNGFEGGFSAIAYVGAHFILGSWYKKSELGTRAAIFCTFGHVGSMTGGWIQAALLTHLDGIAHLPAWRWIFIVVSVVTIPSALFGWVFIPNMPSKQDAWYLTQDEREHAYRRLGEPRKYTWDRTVFRRVLLSWQFWLLPTVFMLYSLSIQMELNNVFQLWMKSRGYTVVQQNNCPTGVYGMAILATIIYSAISDKIQSRWQCSLVIGFTFVIGSSILIADPERDAGHFFAFYLLGTTYAPQALWYAWMADVTAHDYQLRAITTGFMNSFDFAFVTWWPLIFYPVTDAPNYRKGYIASLVTGTIILPLVGVIAYLEKRGIASQKLGRTAVEERSIEGDEGRPQARAEALGIIEKH